MGTDQAALAAQVNYLRQILNHVNPYTHVAIKDEPSILFIELVKSHGITGGSAGLHPLYRRAHRCRPQYGCRKLIFTREFGLPDRRRDPALQSEGITFRLVPTGLNAGHELEAIISAVPTRIPYAGPELARCPDRVRVRQPDLRTGNVSRDGRVFAPWGRSSRDVRLRHAGHLLPNLAADALLEPGLPPRKARSAIIARAMRRLRACKTMSYPQNTPFGDFHIAYDVTW